MLWDLAGRSLGDSLKESGSLLGTRRKIAGKKTGGLAARLPEVAGVCGRFDLHPKKIGSRCRYASRRRTREWMLVCLKEDLKVDIGCWRRTTIKL
ncbi:hypothetical protein B296_00026664 [Ensete ventricosum]|uniref:Uncharacterized protein n=1 Tax=Ensete ventricosum TaxID=4639 RepID=A0A427A2Y9_ENSVE|nr:hypothetical protein B296_00026664 [Ensete ventricosum]